MKLLLVDDDPMILLLAARVLEQAGFSVTAVSSAAEALAGARRDPPDAFLLDFQLEDMDGDVLLARLREEAALAATPVVFLTGASGDPELARIRSLGARGVIEKPFDPAELPARVRALLEGE